MNNFPNQLDKFTIGEKISQKIVTEKRNATFISINAIIH